MKPQHLFLYVLALTISIFGIGCAPTSAPSGSSGNNSAATLQLTSTSYAIAYGGSATITASGGAEPYTFSVVGNVGTITPATSTTATYTAPASGNTYVQINVVDGASATATLYITIGSTGGGGQTPIVVVSPLNPVLSPGGTQAFSVSGGTPPYYYIASAGSFSSTGVYTAPTTAQTVTATFYDSAGNSTQTNIYVGTTPPPAGGGGTVTANCTGNFNLLIGNVTATLTLVQNSNGQIAGSISFPGYGVTDAVQGTCTSSTINFTRLPSNQQWTGTLIVNANNSSQIYMTGTVNTSAGTQSWTGSNY